MTYRIVHKSAKPERCFTVHRDTLEDAMAYWRTLMRAKKDGEAIAVYDGQGRPYVMEHGKYGE